MLAEVVQGIAMFIHGWSTGQNVGITLGDGIRIDPLQPVEESRIPVEMIEVFEQTETMYLCKIRVGFVLGNARGKLDGHLFED